MSSALSLAETARRMARGTSMDLIDLSHSHAASTASALYGGIINAIAASWNAVVTVSGGPICGTTARRV
ncbi:MAG TPA: hypothetical protein VF940_30950 [Streptosporangiaceae bacterium]